MTYLLKPRADAVCRSGAEPASPFVFPGPVAVDLEHDSRRPLRHQRGWTERVGCSPHRIQANRRRRKKNRRCAHISPKRRTSALLSSSADSGLNSLTRSSFPLIYLPLWPPLMICVRSHGGPLRVCGAAQLSRLDDIVGA